MRSSLQTDVERSRASQEAERISPFSTRLGQVRDDIVNLGAHEGSALVDGRQALSNPENRGRKRQRGICANLPSKGLQVLQRSARPRKEDKTPFTLAGDYEAGNAILPGLNLTNRACSPAFTTRRMTAR